MGLSFSRFWGIALKEFVQLRRDRLTFAMIVGIPIAQLLLFGFAINADPKNLPTAVLSADNSEFGRSVVRALENSGYFRVLKQLASEAEGDAMLAQGEVQFVVTIPENFSRKLMRGERPVVLVEADATDPAATSNALGALAALGQSALSRDLQGALAHLNAPADPFELRVHRRYNPEGVTQYNIVPGLMGVILTMTLILMTGLAMTRERERGTFENLLATPAMPLEVMTGKIVPYIVVGFLQAFIIMTAARALFDVPMIGSLVLLVAAMTLYIAALLALGFTISTVARNQLQAMQMTFFFFLPSLLLSGFMFPFRGMPGWAQAVGEIFPLTHFLRIVRGVLLKGNSAGDIAPHLWPIAAFLVTMAAIALLRYRRTLD